MAVNEWAKQAIEKLDAGSKAGIYDRCAAAMKNAVHEALASFCKQDAEFAQAVVQGGSFEDCMKAVAMGCGSSISDLDAYRKAVRFYFPGADVRFHMSVDLCASVDDAPEEAPKPKTGKQKLIRLEDFLV